MTNPYDPGTPPPPPPGQPYGGQPYGGQPHPGQPYGGQPYGGQPHPGQPHPGQPHPGQPHPGQPHPGQQYGGTPGGALSAPARNIGWVITGAAVVTAIAAFLPWVTIEGESFAGLGGDDVGGAKDGAITLVLALLAAGAGVARGLGKQQSKAQTAWPIVALVAGALVALIGIIDIADVSSIADDYIGSLDVGVGFGLWLTLLGGLVVVGAAIGGLVKRR